MEYRRLMCEKKGLFLQKNKVESHKSWLNARKLLFKSAKEQVRARFPEQDEEVLAYEKSFLKEFQGVWKDSTREALLTECLKKDVVLAADFHAFAQSQRSHLRLLRDLQGQRPLVLALECFSAEDNVYIEAYLNGKLSEDEFLDQVKWESEWGFPWGHYKPLIAFCVAHSIPIFGINVSEDSLGLRDQFAASEIDRIKQIYPDSLCIAVYGEYHLAKPYLPNQLKKKNLHSVSVFQNSEDLYFKLARKSLEDKVDVLKGGVDRFCIMTSPPWVQWQSFQMFLDKYVDQDLDEDGVVVDYTDYVSTLIQFAGKDLGLHISTNHLDVFSPAQDNGWRIYDLELTPLESKWIKYNIENDRSFYFKKYDIAYLSRATINHAATLAGYYIQAQVSGLDAIKKNTENFTRFIWIEGWSFFVGKLINHKRKADSFENIQAQLKLISPDDGGRETFKVAMEQKFKELSYIMGQEIELESQYSADPNNIYEAAKILGSMMGNEIYSCFREGRVSVAQVREYLKYDIKNNDFEQVYYDLVRDLSSQNRKRRRK